MKQQDLTNARRTGRVATDIFNELSRTELLAVLGLMHRILAADNKGELDHLVTELPKLLGHSKKSLHDYPGIHACDGLPATSPATGKHTYQMLDYVFSCLSKAQAKMEPQRAGQLPAGTQPCHLSPRELTVLLWMKEGKTNWEIARIVGLSERTVRFHVGSIFEKLDVTSRTQAVARALGAGLIAS